MSSVVAVTALQVVAVAVGGPLLVGLMRKVRCRLEGRAGPPIRQPLLDLRKLMRKERTRPEGASWVFSAAPLVLVGSVAVAAAVAPLLGTAPPSAPRPTCSPWCSSCFWALSPSPSGPSTPGRRLAAWEQAGP